MRKCFAQVEHAHLASPCPILALRTVSLKYVQARAVCVRDFKREHLHLKLPEMEDLDSTIPLASASGCVWWFGTRYFQITSRLARSCSLPSPWSTFWAWRAEQSPARYDAHGILEPHQDQEVFGSDSGWDENTKFACESATSVLRSLQRQHQMQAHQVLQGASNLVLVDKIQVVEPHGGLGVNF